MNFSRLSHLAEQVVATTQARLPEPVRGPAAAVAVHFAPRPGEEIAGEDFEPDILGLFTGPAHADERGEDNLLPPQIFLYLENIWSFAAGDQGVFREEVQLTYLHELGHYLGWDEDDLAARGLE
jgi:predicted Zn-dependent protease with MMP-like domain